MQRLTPEEFYAQNPLRELDKHGKRMDAFTYYDMLDFAEAYAEHCEQRAWIGDRFPDDTREGISDNVLVSDGVSFGVAAFQFKTETWHWVEFTPTHWQELPTLPKQ